MPCYRQNESMGMQAPMGGYGLTPGFPVPLVQLPMPTGSPTGPAYSSPQLATSAIPPAQTAFPVGITPTQAQFPVITAPIQVPQTVESPLYTAGFLRTQIGRKMRVEFLIGSGALVDRSGTLISVGSSYILLRLIDSDDIMLCDLYSIKFVTIIM